MKKINIYNIKAEKIGEKELNSSIFEVPVKMELVHQALIAQMANGRVAVAHTKGRAEVRGGGKKPWRQKGTGRARHGSIRSPLWVGGGITFGPTKDRNFSVKINKKMKKKALDMVLSDKASNDKIVLLDKIELASHKTKDMLKFLEAFKKITKSDKKTSKMLIIYNETAGNLIKAGKNVEKIKMIGDTNLNIKDVLDYEYLMISEKSLKVIEELYGLIKE